MGTLLKSLVIVLVTATFLVRVLAVASSYRGHPGDALVMGSGSSRGTLKSPAGMSIRGISETSEHNRTTFARPRLAHRPTLQQPMIITRVVPPAFLPQPFIAPVALLHPPT
jgi:hypothetical protein